MRKFKWLRLNKREQLKFSIWTKEQIYEQYIKTHRLLVQDRDEVNRLRMIIAGLELDLRRADARDKT